MSRSRLVPTASHVIPRCVTNLLLGQLLVLGLLAVGSSKAAWTEGGCTILSLGELQPMLEAHLGVSLQTTIPDGTPLLIPRGLAPESPKALNIALTGSGLALRTDGATTTIVLGHQLTESARALTRLLPAAPVAPGVTDPGAISRGGVAIFGQLLEPPFLVESTPEAVEINGVLVFPSPGPDVEPPQPTAEQTLIHERMSAAREAYAWNRSALGVDEARRRLLDAVAGLPGVGSAEWADDEELVLFREDGIEEVLWFPAETMDFSPPTPADRRAFMGIMAEGIRRSLCADRTVLCGATYLITVDELPAEALRGRLLEIISSTEPENLRLARLQAHTGHRDAAADLLFAGN